MSTRFYYYFRNTNSEARDKYLPSVYCMSGIISLTQIMYGKLWGKFLKDRQFIVQVIHT